MTQQNLKVLYSAGLEPMVAGLLPVLLAAASLPGSAPSHVVPHSLLSPLPSLVLVYYACFSHLLVIAVWEHKESQIASEYRY